MCFQSIWETNGGQLSAFLLQLTHSDANSWTEISVSNQGKFQFSVKEGFLNMSKHICGLVAVQEQQTGFQMNAFASSACLGGLKAFLPEAGSVIPWHPCRNLIQRLQPTPWDHKPPLRVAVHPDTRRSSCNHKATGTRKPNVSPLRQVQTALYTQLW